MTCSLPGCDQPVIDWLDSDYCSVSHRTRALVNRGEIPIIGGPGPKADS